MSDLDRATTCGAAVLIDLEDFLQGATGSLTPEQAVDRMTEHAKQLGANAVLEVRFDSCDVAENLNAFDHPLAPPLPRSEPESSALNAPAEGSSSALRTGSKARWLLASRPPGA